MLIRDRRDACPTISSAPKSSNNSSACVSEISSGFSSQRNFRKSSTPAALSVSTTSARSRRLISGNSCGARSSCSSPRPKPHATPGAVRPARPARWSAMAWLIFSISSVLMPRYGIVTRNARQPAVNHQPHAVNGERRLGDVGGHDDFALVVARHGGVLVARRQFAVQRQQNETFRLRRVADGLDGLRNFKAARHEHQHVTVPAGTDVVAESLRRLFPNRRVCPCNPAVRQYSISTGNTRPSEERTEHENYLEQPTSSRL